MNTPVVGKERPEMRENMMGGGCINMMQEAVYQNEIEPLSYDRIVCDISYYEVAAPAPPRVVDVTFVRIYAQIIGAIEMMEIGRRTATNVQHPPDRPQVIMR